MGQYLSFRLIYGVTGNGDTEHLWDHDELDGEWDDAIAVARGATPVDWSTCPDTPWVQGQSYEDRRAIEKAAYDEWKSRPEVKAQREVWDAAVAQVKADFPHLEQDWGGVGDSWSCDVLGIENSGFSAGDAVTPIDGDQEFIAADEWADELKRVLTELGIHEDDVTGPQWLAVISYG